MPDIKQKIISTISAGYQKCCDTQDCSECKYYGEGDCEFKLIADGVLEIFSAAALLDKAFDLACQNIAMRTSMATTEDEFIKETESQKKSFLLAAKNDIEEQK